MTSELTVRHLRRALDVMHLLRADVVSTDALAAFRGLVDCDRITCTRADHIARRVTGGVADRPENNLLRAPGFRDRVHQHPAFTAHRDGKLKLGKSVALTDLADLRTLRGFEFYTDFYRPRDTIDELLCVVQIDQRHGRVLTLCRSRPGFTAAEKQLIDLVAPHLAQAFARRERSPAVETAGELTKQALALLTPRERAVTSHLVHGATDHEIARNLAISPRTVQTHLQHVYRKLGLTNRTGLVALISGHR